MIQKTVVV